MSDYHKGRYDELLERYTELQQMHENCFGHFSTSLHTGKISGAQVHYYAGIRVDPSTVGLRVDSYDLWSYNISIWVPLQLYFAFQKEASGKTRIAVPTLN